MSEQQMYDEAMAAIEKAVVAVDASLSTLVLARENLLDKARDLARAHQGGREQAPDVDPLATIGQQPDGECEHDGPRTSVETMTGIAQFCACGEQVSG